MKSFFSLFFVAFILATAFASPLHSLSPQAQKELESLKQTQTFEKTLLRENEYDIEVPPVSGKGSNYWKDLLLKNYLETSSSARVSPLNHYTANIFGGLITGAAVGALGGLSPYSSANKTKSLNSIYISAGVMAFTGVVTAVILTAVERKYNQPYAISKGLFTAVWAGILSGGALGVIAATIPYAKNNNTDVLMQGAGIGSLVGFVFGFVGYFVAPYVMKKKNTRVAFFYNSELTGNQAIQHRLYVQTSF